MGSGRSDDADVMEAIRRPEDVSTSRLEDPRDLSEVLKRILDVLEYEIGYAGIESGVMPGKFRTLKEPGVDERPIAFYRFIRIKPVYVSTLR